KGFRPKRAALDENLDGSGSRSLAPQPLCSGGCEGGYGFLQAGEIHYSLTEATRNDDLVTARGLFAIELDTWRASQLANGPSHDDGKTLGHDSGVGLGQVQCGMNTDRL